MDTPATPVYVTTYYGYRQLLKVINALCEDGIRRNATITSEADTYFSQPARVSVQGKTVSGFISGATHDPSGMQDYTFTAYRYGKNGHLLKSAE